MDTRESKETLVKARDPTNYTLSLNLTCTSGADAIYSETYHPSYNIHTKECSGYLNTPLKINCTADRNISSDTRRLCNCVDRGKLSVLSSPVGWRSGTDYVLS